MATVDWLKSTLGLPWSQSPRIEGPRVGLRPARASDYTAWSSLRHVSRDFLTPWEPVWPADSLSRSAFRRRLQRYARDWQNDTSYTFFIFLLPDAGRTHETLVGGVTLSNVRRGVSQSGSLGYWMGAPYAGRGLMSEGVQCLLDFAFDELMLHRVEAACLPNNTASAALLRKSGFQEEGMARRYLKINGLWQDHILFAMLRDDARPRVNTRIILG